MPRDRRVVRDHRAVVAELRRPAEGDADRLPGPAALDLVAEDLGRQGDAGLGRGERRQGQREDDGSGSGTLHGRLQGGLTVDGLCDTSTPPRVEDHGGDDHPAGHDPLGRLGGADLRQAALQHGDDQHAEEAADHRAPAAHQAGAADDDGGDGRQLEADAAVRVGRLEVGEMEDAGQAGQGARQAEDRRARRAADRCPTAAPLRRWCRWRRGSGRTPCATAAPARRRRPGRRARTPATGPGPAAACRARRSPPPT